MRFSLIGMVDQNAWKVALTGTKGFICSLINVFLTLSVKSSNSAKLLARR